MEFPYKNFLADFFTAKLSLQWSIRLHLMHLAHQNRSGVRLTKVQFWTRSGSETGPQLASIWIKMSVKSIENTLVSIVFSVFSSQASYFSTFERGGCVQDATESRIQDLGHVVWGGQQWWCGGASDPDPARLRNFKFSTPMRRRRSFFRKFLL